MSDDVSAVLRYCAARGIHELALAVPGPLCAVAVGEIRRAPQVVSVYAAVTPEEGLGLEVRALQGPADWRTFVCGHAVPVLAGRSLLLPVRALLAAAAVGRFAVICCEEQGCRRVSLFDIGRWCAADALLRLAQFGRSGRFLRRPYERLRRSPALHGLWCRLFRGGQRPGCQGEGQGQGQGEGQSQGEGVAADADLAAADAVVRRAPAPYSASGGRPRVLMVCESLQIGGAERQLTNTALALHAGGVVDATVVAAFEEDFDGAGFGRRQLSEGGVRVASLPRRYRPHLQALEMFPVALADAVSRLPYQIVADVVDLYLLFRAHRPDVVHAWQDAMNVRAGLAAALAGTPRIVLSCRSVAPTHFDFWQPYMRPVYRALLAGGRARLLNNSAAGARSYAQWLGTDLSGIRVVRNGFAFAAAPAACVADALLADAAARARFGLPDGVPVVGTVMRFAEEKQPFLWLTMAERVLGRVPDCHFLLVGDGPLRRDVLDACGQGRLRGRVVAPGAVRNASDAMAAMDVFVLASRIEGLSNVAVEAQWAGRPVVAFDVGGLPECVLPAVSGRLVRERTAAALADAVVATLADDGLRQRARREGPARMRAMFGIERMASETLAAYAD